MAKLRVDLDILQQTIDTYNTEITNLRNAKKTVQKSLTLLKSSGWDSNASKAWFALLDDEWINNIEYQIRVLERLKNNLIIARNEYVNVYNEQVELQNYL